jgi:hypothetical protein
VRLIVSSGGPVGAAGIGGTRAGAHGGDEDAVAESARVVFSSFRSGHDPMLESWSRFREAVDPPVLAPVAAHAPGQGLVPAAGGAASGGRTGVWRLLATNNRELCRSAHIYPTFSGARAHVAVLRERIDDLVVTPVIGARPGSRGWYMTLNGVIVVTCGRWYGAAASSAEAASASLEALATAVIMEESRAVTAPGRRAGRASVARPSEASVW